MRELSFFLRLHSAAPLARLKGTTSEPYLPLEVRYIIRPTGEVLLYVSNDPNRQTSYDDLSLFGSNRFWNRLFPSTDGAVGLLRSCPKRPENVYSYHMVEDTFIGMLCRRRLACHYLSSYNFSDFTFRRKKRRNRHLHPAWFLLIGSAILSAFLVGRFFWLPGIEISTWWPLALLIIWLGGTFLIFTIMMPFIGEDTHELECSKKENSSVHNPNAKKLQEIKKLCEGEYRDIYKRIDENRELLNFLQRNTNVLRRFPFVEGWIAENDCFFKRLRCILELPESRSHHFPRPWPGSPDHDLTSKDA